MPARPGDYKLRKLTDVRRFTARILNDFRQGRLNTHQATAYVPLIRTLMDVMKAEAAEMRHQGLPDQPKLSGKKAVDDIVRQLRDAADKALEHRQPIEADATVLEESN